MDKRQSLKDVKRDAEALTLKRLEEDGFEARYPNGYRVDALGEEVKSTSKAEASEPKSNDSHVPEKNALGESLMPKEDSALKGTKTPQEAKAAQDEANAKTAKKEDK